MCDVTIIGHPIELNVRISHLFIVDPAIVYKPVSKSVEIPVENPSVSLRRE